MKNKKFIICGSVISLGVLFMVNQQIPNKGTTDNIKKEVVETTQDFDKIAKELKEPVVVGEVFSDGYLKKHGNHYHFVKGKPPVDAIFEKSEQHHAFTYSEKDIVSENEKGYVIRHGDHYHFVFKDNKPKLLNRLSDKVTHPMHAEYPMDNIVSEDEFGYIVQHDDHYHYVYKNESEKTPNQEKREENHFTRVDEQVELKKKYITQVYGVPYEAIRVSDNYFVFNDPSHAYDPTHIHPYVIAISQLEIPEVTGNAEIDFENELIAVSKRVNIPIHKLQIQNGKFVLPHGTHNHYINILQQEGMSLFFKNQLPNIQGEYIAGDFDRKVVVEKIEDIKNIAKQQYKDDELQYRRILRALSHFEESLVLEENSTQGYLKALLDFEKQYVKLSDNSSELTTADKQENSLLVKEYQQLVEQIKKMPIELYGQTKVDSIKTLQMALEKKDEAVFRNYKAFLQAVEDVENAPSDLGMAIYFIDFFVKRFNYMSSEQKEIVLPLLQQLKQIPTVKNILLPLVKMQIALGNVSVQQDHSGDFELYELIQMVNEMREFVIDMGYLPSHRLNDGFMEPIQ